MNTEFRQYNPETDYHIIEKAAREEQSLACVARHLRENGIAWPRNFNGDNSPSAVALDRDICRSWGC